MLNYSRRHEKIGADDIFFFFILEPGLCLLCEESAVAGRHPIESHIALMKLSLYFAFNPAARLLFTCTHRSQMA